MKKPQVNKLQSFIDAFNLKFYLPDLKVKVVAGRNHIGAICIRKGEIILWKEMIPTPRFLMKVLLHELAHWWLYHYLPRRHKNETDVCQLTETFLKRYYQKKLL